MAMVTLKEVLPSARDNGYAVGAFNCYNMETVKAVVEAAEAERAPVIIQVSQSGIKYAGLGYIAGLVRIASQEVTVPVVLHLDHGTDFGQIVQCIRAGFTSVMIDASKYPMEDNVSLTKKVVELCRPAGISVEAELGTIGGVEDDVAVDEWDARFTSPRDAHYFVGETGVDALAVAIGTAHGRYRGVPRLDFARLAVIGREVSCPLVLHGCSGVPEPDIRQAVSLGICKVNIDTDIREALTGAMREALTPSAVTDPRVPLGAGKEAAVRIVRDKIRMFGSQGKA